MLYFKFPEGFIERVFPVRLDVCLSGRPAFHSSSVLFQYRVQSKQIESEADASRQRRWLK